MTVPDAAQRVLETPELLEMIISDLPTLEILVLQRVSPVWHGVISNSPAIQKLLFLRSDWNLEGKSFNAYRAINRPGERPRNNRMLRRVLDGRYPTVTMKISNDDPEEQESGVRVPEDTAGIDAPRRSKPDVGVWSWDVNITFPADRLPASNSAIMYEGASWRKMYICQPPCTALHLVRRWQRSSSAAMTCDTGITMDFFMDKASSVKDAWHHLFIGGDRDWHFEGPIKCSSIEE